MKPFWMAVCAVALGACSPAAQPAPQAPGVSSRLLPPPPPPPEPLVVSEGHGPEAVRERLFREHPHHAAVIAGLRIVEDDGAVTLVGFAPDQQTCHELLASAKHVSGVRAVRNEIFVLERHAPEASVGSRTGEAIRSWLRRERPDAIGTDDSFKVYESDGLVTLYGKVNDEQARRDLISRVKQMPDVKQVDDRLEVGRGEATAAKQATIAVPVSAAAPEALAPMSVRTLR